MTKKVYETGIDKASGNASRTFQEEHAQIVGNKVAIVTLNYTVADGAPVALAKIPFTLTSQVDGSGNAITLFEIDANNNLKLKAGNSITNITQMKFWDDVVFRRNSGSAGTPDVTNSQVVSALYVNTTNNTTQKTVGIMGHMFDNTNITGTQTYEWKRHYEVMVDKELPNGLVPSLGIAYSNTLYGAQELQLKSMEVVIMVKYYDAQATGGN